MVTWVHLNPYEAGYAGLILPIPEHFHQNKPCYQSSHAMIFWNNCRQLGDSQQLR